MIASVVSLSKTGTMFFILSTTFSLVILVGLALQAMPVLRLIRTIGQPSPEPLEDRECPPVAILLSLRGGDPFLSDCLKKLLQQDYPDYELVIALDHERDPAARYVDQVIDDLKPANLTKKIITRREANCTLLNNNYAQLVEELDDRFEIVVLVDADAVTWKGWLRSLVQPLVRDESVGGTSGNRWYTPDNANIGTLTRCVWNMGSIVQMATMQYPWGGSMALRADVAKSPEMLQCWRSTFTGDTPLFKIIRDRGKKYHFNPEIILLNREDTTLHSFCNWMPRQMLNGKLYHPLWLPVLAQAILSTILLVAAVSTNLANIVTGNWLAFGILGGSLTLFWISIFGLFVKMNRVIGSKALVRGDRMNWLTLSAAHKLFWVIPMVQIVYFLGVLKSLFIRNVCWRGIDYVIRGPFDIQLVEYKPFRQDPQAENQSL